MLNILAGRDVMDSTTVTSGLNRVSLPDNVTVSDLHIGTLSLTKKLFCLHVHSSTTVPLHFLLNDVVCTKDLVCATRTPNSTVHLFASCEGKSAINRRHTRGVPRPRNLLGHSRRLEACGRHVRESRGPRFQSIVATHAVFVGDVQCVVRL